jgi:hypothetical protein
MTRLLVLVAALSMLACEELPVPPNLPPVANFVHSPVSPIIAGATTVVFNASGSVDADGQVVSYTWSFGDGTPDQVVSSPVVTHVFPDTPHRCVEVTYTTLLVIADDKGSRASASRAVSVVELPLPSSLECQPPR